MGTANEQLVEAARAGSGRAYAQLYASHVGIIERLARSRASRDQSTVNDIVQEVFTRGLERLGQLRESSRFGSWIYAIALHVIADHHRSAARLRPLDSLGSDPVIAHERYSPEAYAVAREVAREVLAGLAELRARDVEAICLAADGANGPTELGEHLGVSPGAAKVVLHRARRRLRLSTTLAPAG